MKKLISLLFAILLLCGCAAEREEYYVFSFDDYSLTPGYDDVEYMRLIFDLELPETIDPAEVLKDNKVHFWHDYLMDVDIENTGRKSLPIEKAKLKRIDFYLENFPASIYRIGDIELSRSVSENCDTFSGKSIDRNGKACVFGKEVDGRKNIVVLYGDLFAVDQDELTHVEIYVE